VYLNQLLSSVKYRNTLIIAMKTSYLLLAVLVFGSITLLIAGNISLYLYLIKLVFC